MKSRWIDVVLIVVALGLFFAPDDAGPRPGPRPEPSPDPIPGEEFAVLILEETADRATIPREQLEIITSTKLRTWLDTHVGKGGYRVWDDDVDASHDEPRWQHALKEPRDSLPWLYVSHGDKNYSGPLPVDLEATLDLLETFR